MSEKLEMTPYEHRLLEMIREIKDPDLLWLLSDGAQARVNRYDERIAPISKETAMNFYTEIQRLYESEKERSHQDEL